MFAPLVLLTLTGCEQVKDIQDTVNGLTNPLVAAGIHLGVEAPESDVIHLENTPFAEGASVKVFLFDAADASSLGDTPVEGAVVDLVSASNGGAFGLEDKGGGAYTARGADGLTYAAEEITVDIDYADEAHSLSSVAPEAPEAGVATTHTAGNPMNIDLSGQGYDGIQVVVLSMSDSEVTFSNEPETIEELYTLTHGSGAVSLEVPAKAFAQPGIYAVAVAGTVNADVDGMVEVNTGLSALVAGKFRFYPVEVE